MSLRRCPACKNMVVREAECPICGMGYRAAVTRRALRWALIAVFVILLAWRLIPHSTPQSDAPASSTETAGSAPARGT